MFGDVSDRASLGGGTQRELGARNGWLAPEDGGASRVNLSEYWRLALKYKFLIAGSTIAVLIAGITITLMMTPMYKASTTLQIDREAARIVDSGDVSPRESMIQGEEFFQTQYGLLRSRSLAEKVVDSLGLASSDAFLVQMGEDVSPSGSGTAAQRLADRRESVLGVIEGGLSISPQRGSRLVTLNFESPDPVLSARIANAFAENFIQSNLDRKFESSKYARDFLEGRIAQTKTKLEDAERQLVAYATDQQIVNLTEAAPDGREAQSLASTNLVALNSALAQATAARMQAESKWRQAESTPAAALTEVLSNSTYQNLTEARARLNGEYQQKLSTYKPDYPEMVQLKAQIDELDSQARAIAGNIRASIRGNYAIALREEQALQNRVSGLTGDVLDLRDRSIQYNILQREVDTSRTLYDGLLQRYKEVGVTGAITTNNVSIVDAAQVPKAPSSPSLMLNVLIALVLGMGLGVVAALILEVLDETLATPEDVESKLRLPVLGVIPALPKGETPKMALEDARSAFSEAYQSLRTALQFSTPNGTPSSLLVTSSKPAEGKSTTAHAVAKSLARVGSRVLLIDGDLRNPSMHRTLGVDNDKGMSNLLSGAADLDALVHRTADEHLFFIPCGPLPPNPAELWGGDRIRVLLEEMTSKFDHVVIDGPPVLGFADAPILAASVGGVIFVLESRGTRRAQARGALRRLSVGHARLLGLVLSKFNTRTSAYGSYDYAYDYDYGASGSKK